MRREGEKENERLHRIPGVGGRSDLGGRPDAVLTWEQTQRMLPLVRSIISDIVRLVNRVTAIEPEKERLDRHRHDLVWLERQRRYQLTDELDRAIAELQHARVELDALAVVLLDAELGLVGFPTLVNNQRAFFSWKPGEEGVSSGSSPTATVAVPFRRRGRKSGGLLPQVSFLRLLCVSRIGAKRKAVFATMTA